LEEDVSRPLYVVQKSKITQKFSRLISPAAGGRGEKYFARPESGGLATEVTEVTETMEPRITADER
jgi:hypothetical protein